MKKLLAVAFSEGDFLRLKAVGARVKSEVIAVEPKEYGQLLRDVLKGFHNPFMRPYRGDAFLESMLIIDGFSGKKLDFLLEELRRQEIRSLKAVATAANKGWSIERLYNEMMKEHEFYAAREK
jgi:hypothetical protein